MATKKTTTKDDKPAKPAGAPTEDKPAAKKPRKRAPAKAPAREASLEQRETFMLGDGIVAIAPPGSDWEKYPQDKWEHEFISLDLKQKAEYQGRRLYAGVPFAVFKDPSTGLLYGQAMQHLVKRKTAKKPRRKTSGAGNGSRGGAVRIAFK